MFHVDESLVLALKIVATLVLTFGTIWTATRKTEPAYAPFVIFGLLAWFVMLAFPVAPS